MAANNGILTYNSGVYNSLLSFYSPISIVPATNKPIVSLYCFLSKVQPWTTEESPPDPEQSQRYLKDVYKNMFFAKQITSNDISPVIERIDWETSTTYEYYRDDVNMMERDVNGVLIRKFYVKNRYDQVFKCLWNNNGGLSTIEPYFEPGTFNANQIFQGADNYKWKYIYTISSGNKLKFVDSDWIPVPVTNVTPNPLENNAGSGSIDVINVTDGGSGYDPLVSPIVIRIVGDGRNASANAIVANGSISDIVMANTGTNYSYANVIITSSTGSGATAISPISPIGGHGFNPISELGVQHIMFTAKFDKDESGLLPTDIDYRQVGIVMNPYAYTGTTFGTANSSTYKLSTDLVVSAGFGAYVNDEVVFQSPDGTFENATFTATVLSFNSLTNVVSLINTQGTTTENTLLFGQTSGTSRVVLQEQLPTFIKNSGYIIYLQNREPVQRDPDGSEIFKLVLGY